MTSVCVVGSGSAGVSAALAAAGLGARVTLVEGGERIPEPRSFWPSLLEPGRHQPSAIGERALGSEGIKVELNQRVTRIGEDSSVTAGGHQARFDAVVLATGSVSLPDRIEGMRKRGVHNLDSRAAYSLLGKNAGEYGRVLVQGGGPVSVEVAERLRARGVSVLISSPGGLLPTLNPGPREVILLALSRFGIGVSERAAEKVVGADRVEAVISSGEVIPCDSFVLVPRFTPSLPEVPGTLGRSGGLVVDRRMRSDHHGVLAAGDCAEVKVGNSTLGLMFESSARLMGAVAGENAAGGSASATVVGSFFKELVGVGLVSSGLGLTEARSLGFDVFESSRSWMGELACSLVFERGTGRILGAQLAGKGVERFSEAVPLIVSSRATLEQVAFQETVATSDISPIAETAREGLKERRTRSS